MKKHGVKWILCLGAALLAFGCSDDSSSDDNDKPTGCTATVCSGDSLIVCNADGTTTTQTCDNGCDATTNQCKAASDNDNNDQGGNDQGGNDQGGDDQGGNDQGGNDQGGSDQGGNDQGGNDQGGAVVDGNLLPVPSSQNNTKGAKCDSTFVEHCDGDTVVYCVADEDDELTVDRINCAEGSMQCAARQIGSGDDAYNFANCYESCTKEGDKSHICSTDEYAAELLVDGVCLNTSKGLLLMEDLDGSAAYCGNVCQNHTCETNKACGSISYEGSCNGDILTFCDMTYIDDEDEEVEDVLHVIDCEYYGMTCQVIEGYSTCD